MTLRKYKKKGKKGMSASFLPAHLYQSHQPFVLAVTLPSQAVASRSHEDSETEAEEEAEEAEEEVAEEEVEGEEDMEEEEKEVCGHDTNSGGKCKNRLNEGKCSVRKHNRKNNKKHK